VNISLWHVISVSTGVFIYQLTVMEIARHILSEVFFVERIASLGFERRIPCISHIWQWLQMR
jgi:hypothetical protein